MAKMIPNWLREVVAEGLMSFVVLGLPNQPPAETVALTGEMWIKALWKHSQSWDEEQDRIRLEEGFLNLLPILERWPLPKDLLAAIPLRPEQDIYYLEAPAMTEKQRQFNLEQIRKIKAQLRALEIKMSMPKKEKNKNA